MKILKHIGIYYIVITVLSFILSLLAVLYLFIPLLPFFVLGIIFLVIYYLRNKKYDKKTEHNKWLLKYKDSIYFVLFFLPIAFYIGLFWYVNRSYNQRIVLPEGYEGVVAVRYNQPDGQEEKWIGGFLGIGADRLIEVDSTGIGKTQFTFINNGLPFLGGQRYYRKGLKIVYSNKIDTEIVKGANANDQYIDAYMNKNPEEPSIYFAGYDHYPLIIFVVAKEENRYEYLMTKEEIEKWLREKKAKNPYTYIEEPTNMLDNKYDYYYKIDPKKAMYNYKYN